MKRFLIGVGGLAFVFALFLAGKSLLAGSMEAPREFVTATPPNAENSIDSEASTDHNAVHGLSIDNIDMVNELDNSSSETEASAHMKLHHQLASMLGVKNAILMSENEVEEYHRWLRDNGRDRDDLMNSDYASYDGSTLLTLAEQQGDTRAYEMLSEKFLAGASPEEVRSFRYLGLTLGSPGATYSLSGEISKEAKIAYDNAEYEAYKELFIGKMAMLYVASDRGLIFSNEATDRVLNGYMLDDDAEEIRALAQMRKSGILREVNQYRKKKGWGPLKELPAALKRHKEAIVCNGSESCERNHMIPKEYVE